MKCLYFRGLFSTSAHNSLLQLCWEQYHHSLTQVPYQHEPSRVTMPPHQRNIDECCDVYDLSPVSSKSIVQKRFRLSLASNQIFPIPRIDDLTEEEIKATWYERGDYEKIKMAMIPLIRKMMKKEKIEESNKETTRGLEYRTRQGAIRRQHNKVEAITAVMDEQDRQMEEIGHLDDELLSSVYCQMNEHCRLEAHQLALGDVEPAREHCADAIELVLRQYHAEAEPSKSMPERKASLGKMMKQVLLRRRPTLTAVRTQEDPCLLVGSAA
jgi:hypothetical protein